MVSHAEAVQKAALVLSNNITSALKELLETKHLYQSVTAEDEPNMSKDFLSAVKGSPNPRFIEENLLRKYKSAWHVCQPSEILEHQLIERDTLFFKAPDVKLFCTKCDRVEAFNYIFGHDVLHHYASEHKPVTQIFVFSFLCQSCKTVPEVFLIRREGNKLTLSGRSPIERVEQPHTIPKTVARFFSGAVVAHQSGQTLPGLFLFRVLIEQWVQSQTEKKGLKADQALDEYMLSLPKDFKERFPSFRTIYENLSADMHSATGSAELFEEARQQIIEHFDARRLFRL